MRPAGRSPIDAIFRKALTKCVPIHVLVELTHRCNLRCRHCYVVPDGQREMTTSELTDALRQLADSGGLFLTLSGGEVLERADFFDVAEAARSLDFALRVFTNGALVDEGVAERLAGLDPVDVSVSVYGPDRASHEYVTRTPGSFLASLAGLERLAERGVSTVMKCTLMRHNLGRIDEIARLAGDVGAVVEFDPLVTPRNDGDRSPLVDKVDASEIEHMLVAGEVGHDWTLSVEWSPCVAARRAVCLSPGGEVYPCVQLRTSMGSLLREPFRHIWERSPAAQRIRALEPADMSACVRCGLRQRCRPCIGLNELERGDMRVPSTLNCELALARTHKGRSAIAV